MSISHEQALNDFWRWIGTNAMNRLGAIDDQRIDDLEQRFQKSEPDCQDRIYFGYQIAMQEADTLAVWQLGSLLRGSTLGDDSFRDFRRWLILHGRNIYDIALGGADDLALLVGDLVDIPMEPYADSIGIPISFAKEIPDPEDVGFSLKDSDWSPSESSEARIKSDLPRLWGLFGGKFKWHSHFDGSMIQVTECLTELGVVRVGDRLRHKVLGEAVLVAIVLPDTYGVELDFGYEKKVFSITSRYFERLS